MNTEIIKEIMIVVGVPILRSFGGWLEKTLQDRRVTRFELRKLFQTTVRLGFIGIAQIGVAKGFLNVELDIASTLAIGGSVFLTDKLFGSLKDNNNVTKR